MTRAILLALVFGAFELCAQNSAPSQTAKLTSYSAGSKEDLSRLAGQLVDETNNARAALKNGSDQAAIDEVNQAQRILNRIEARAPRMHLVPVYQEFVSVSILTPVVAEHNSRKALQQKVANNNNGPAVVHQVAGEYTRVMLDTNIAKKALATAEYDLGMADWNGADRALSEVQEAVGIESVKSDMPLSRARENLILARFAVRQKNYSEAKDSLEAASRALAAYVAEGGTHAEQAKDLEQPIRELANNIQQDNAQAVSTINDWWNTTSNWSAYRPAESAQSQTASR
jgi:YfdX protein